VFRVGLTKKTPEAQAIPSESALGISMIVCSHSNSQGLQKLVPLLLQQEYPLFELIVVNDRSSDDSEAWLNKTLLIYSNLKVITIKETPKNWNPKKYALQQGFKHAQYPLLALTDSDCMPLSRQWLRHMSLAFQNPRIDIFLGYSPYAYQKGLLNRIVRTETVYTAFQYLSLAKLNMTYMGVGRNLGYRKSFITKHLDTFPFQNYLGGDDDLLINSLSSGNDASIGLHPDSFMQSDAPSTWRAWWRQKRRHLSAGQKYKFSTQCLLSSYWCSSLGFWLLLIPLYLLSASKCPILSIHAFILTCELLLLSPLFRIFQERRLLTLLPIWDFLYIASSSVIGLSTFWIKNKRWS